MTEALLLLFVNRFIKQPIHSSAGLLNSRELPEIVSSARALDLTLKAGTDGVA